MPAKSAPIDRRRLDVTLDVDLLEWIRSRTHAGDPFSGDGQALEFCLARLHAEQQQVRQLCRQHGVAFDAAVFWRLYEAHIGPSKRMGRPRRDQKREERERVSGGVDVGLVKWIDSNCRSGGAFETASHLVETSVRYVHSLDAGQIFVLEGFPFDGAALWAQYRKLAEQAVKA